ncbi:conserved hypothetical protein [Desulfatibacillum aliphaticivorans]|uniref:CN hydrolase domain-containing protein n=1 Tax=Desulfatibacillum aliphaticivorans TaxID=218208 RepID=B8FLS8_DESAL|nr:reverse transcriptase domain-containing protein [Desulfatibacillum aliphaticivorans]ACL05432.1 conserved hypothetical protein [Desulfatibacillum aliphaticivorans]
MNLVQSAYKKLKQDCYYDTVNLFLRYEMAQFEVSDDFNDRMEALSDFVDDLQDSGEIDETQFKRWLKKISCWCLPKAINNSEPEQNGDSCFISNIRTERQYEVNSVNYFIKAPIELFILDVIWSMKVGVLLDRRLEEYCLGNRLEYAGHELPMDENGKLFKIYHRQYSMWRDTAIDKAKKALENGTDIMIIGLDIMQCYYHIKVDWNSIEAVVANDYFGMSLCTILKRISTKYIKKLRKNTEITHPTVMAEDEGLPIGLSSSGIIANWALNIFDQAVRSKLSPLYYGRYVDDILIVLQSPQINAPDGCTSAIDKLFIETQLLNTQSEDTESDDNIVYSLKELPSLKIQPNKLIFQYFDAKHSHAGLKEFSREILAQASEFRFLPVGDDLRGLDDCAYDLIYKGSLNKLRSVVGMEENSFELSKYLSRRIIQYRLCRDPLNPESLEQLFRFYKGRNVFDFCRLWEKVFTLLLTNKLEAKCAQFYNQCEDIIGKLEFDDPIYKRVQERKSNLLTDLKDDILTYLNCALAIPLGLMSTSFQSKCKSRKLQRILSKEIIEDTIDDAAYTFRESNLIRHQFVSYPLLNYTSYDGNLISPVSGELPKVDDWSIDEKAVYSPRYIHNDELQLFAIFQCLCDEDENPEEYHQHVESLIAKLELKNEPQVVRKSKKKNGKLTKPKLFTIKCDQPEKANENKSIVVGIANLKASESDIERAYRPNGKQNLSFKRQSNLYGLLNSAIEGDKCDIAVFPELSIPYAWVSTMAAFSRKHQIALVFGAEHVVTAGEAHNIVFTLLPYHCRYGQKGCYISARLKNYYAPAEKEGLRVYGLDAVSPAKPYYEIFRWGGTTFSVFNCFELTNIAHRGLMQSELDFLVTVAWNKDVRYYDHILTSTSRDLHCYIVHSNTSQYGDSRVIAPKRHEEMNDVRIKGGMNSVLMKSQLAQVRQNNFPKGKNSQKKALLWRNLLKIRSWDSM